MMARVIRAAIAHRAWVLLAALVLAGFGIFSMLNTPIDALPDLSDTQVVIRTSWAGQSPQIVEDQVTYPLVTTMQPIRINNLRADNVKPFIVMLPWSAMASWSTGSRGT